MKRYFSQQDFITFLNLLEINKETPLYTEDVEGNEFEYTFLKFEFLKEEFIMYGHPGGGIGLIQDTQAASWVDYAEEIFKDFEQNGEYKVFIKTD